MNLAQVMLRGIDDEDHVCTVYVVCTNELTLRLSLKLYLQLYIEYCKNGGVTEMANLIDFLQV